MLRAKQIAGSREKIKLYHQITKRTPPLGIEPRTCRLTADRSANGALKAAQTGQGSQSTAGTREVWGRNGITGRL